MHVNTRLPSAAYQRPRFELSLKVIELIEFGYNNTLASSFLLDMDKIIWISSIYALNTVRYVSDILIYSEFILTLEYSKGKGRMLLIEHRQSCVQGI